MTNDETSEPATALRAALDTPDESARLRAAMVAGTNPDSSYIPVLISQCADEPDFFVRDALTWAITRHDPALTVDPLISELTSATPQARSQALHTLSKIGDKRAWASITTDLLYDQDDEVARAAWRTAVGLVPELEAPRLAEVLATQFARGGRDVQLSLSRAFVGLGPAAKTVVTKAQEAKDEEIRVHAYATARLMANPEAGFDDAVYEARRLVALLGAPEVDS